MLGGCAHYAPAPLATPEAALAAPDLALLSAEAARIERPFLASQAIDLSKPLTLNEIAVITVLANPDLKAQRAKAGVTDAQAFAARLLPDPTAQLSFDKLISGPDMLNGFGGQLGFDLAQLRTARITRESGAASRSQVRLDLAWAEWQYASNAQVQAVRIVALRRQLELARATLASAETWLGRVQRAAGRGDVAGSDTDARRLALIDASDKVRTGEHDLAAARLELNKLMGIPPDTVIAIAEPAAPVIPPDAATLTAQAIGRRLDLAALRAGYGVGEADVHKAILEQFPNISLTVASARDTAGNLTIGPQLGFSLPLWNRNRGAIAITNATRAQLRAEYDARLFQTRADIAAAVSGLAVIRQQRAELVAQLPAIERYAAATARAAKRGDLSLSTAESAAQSLRDRRSALAALYQQAAEQTILLEQLSGGPSEGWSK
ncbi:MAG: TolC family protein [Sphingomicrobium sp.]